MRTDCVLKPEWIRSVERTMLGPMIGRLHESRWPEVRAAVLLALGL
jgi:mRNA-degrading endonuclease toxin of MazEF toxin-antitoxin module